MPCVDVQQPGSPLRFTVGTSTVGSEVNNRGLFVQEVPANAGEIFKVAVSKFVTFPPVAAESAEARTARIDGYLSEATDVYHVHMFDATELEKDEMVVFDVPPAADPVCARQRGIEAISAALRSNSRAPRAPLAPGPQMMTRQQMEALGVEMQSHAGQRFAMMNGETSIFNYANDAAYTSDCTKAEYEARGQMNNAALEMGVSANGVIDKLYIRITQTVATGGEVFLTYGWPFWEDVRHKQDEFPRPHDDVMRTGADTLLPLEDMMGVEQSVMQVEVTSNRHAHRASGSGGFAVLDPNLMPENDVPAVPHGPDGVELHLSSRSNTGYQGVSYITDKPRAKPFRAKVGGGNVVGFYATALEAAVAYRQSAGAMPKPAGRVPTARPPKRAAAEFAAIADTEEPALPMAATEAQAQATAEGLTLARSDNRTGFRNVKVSWTNEKGESRYQAQMNRDGEAVTLGHFATAEEAALHVARTPEEQARADTHRGRRKQVWDTEIGEFVDPITGDVWSLDAKQQESRKRLGAPVRLRNERRPQACRSRLEVTAELVEAPQDDAQPSSALMWQIGDRGAWEAGDADLEAAFGPSAPCQVVPDAPLPPLSVPLSALPVSMLNETGYSDERLRSYEQQRMRNIAENRRKLRELGINETKPKPRCVAPSDMTQEQRDDADYAPERRADRVDQVQRPPSSRMMGRTAATNGAS